MADIQSLLDSVIETEIQNLGSLSSGSDEKSKAIQNLATLHKLRIEEIKAETEAEEKRERRVMDSEQRKAELALKEKQATQQETQQQAELSIKERQVDGAEAERKMKASEVAEETKETIDEIHEAESAGVTRAGKDYSAEDTKKDLTTVYIQTGVKYAKLYAPSIILGAASITCIVASHRVLKKRNIALAAAYTTLDKSFKDYRGRVMERFGEQVEKEIRYNIKAQEVKKTVVDENGKKEKVKEVVDVPAVDGWDPSQYSPYARRFDEAHPQWTKNPEMNLYYLKARQAQATDMLKARGHLFLNEVYDMLGFPRTKAGAVVGWLYDPKHPELGDPYVDFGMYEIQEGDSFESYTKSYILDFNVVGDITDDIADHQYI